MRVVVMFDLPVLTAQDKKEYRQFRKVLIKSGYMMLQESVYCKLAPNGTMAEAMVAQLRKQKPEKGLVQVLRVTEKQYTHMDFIVGQTETDILSSANRLVIL